MKTKLFDLLSKIFIKLYNSKSKLIGFLLLPLLTFYIFVYLNLIYITCKCREFLLAYNGCNRNTKYVQFSNIRIISVQLNDGMLKDIPYSKLCWVKVYKKENPFSVSGKDEYILIIKPFKKLDKE